MTPRRPADLEKPRWLDVATVARRWGVSRATVHRLIDDGTLSGLRVRGKFRITRQSVETYEDRQAF